MATITVRNLSQATVDALKVRARQNARSMEAEAREVLSRAAEGEKGQQAARPGAELRWAVQGAELMRRVGLSPAPEVDASSWLADIRGDGDRDDLIDPWKRHAAS